MILAAGLTPAWQYVLVFDHLRTGEVNRARESRWFASGKAVNVALAVHSLGIEGRLVSFLGGATGAALAEDFESTGAAAEWVTSSTATRVCTTLIHSLAGETTELVENSPAVSPQELARYARAFTATAEKSQVLVLSGSLPTDTPRSYYRDLLAASAHVPALHSSGNRPANLVFDFRGPELQECLAFRPFLVKPNREELAATVGRTLDDDSSLLAAMRELNTAGAEWVLVTQGGGPAWLTGCGETWRVQPPVGINVVNPIGCGDSVAAGIAVGLSTGLPVRDCVSLGIGAAAANLEQMECARFEAGRARELAKGASWERVEGVTA
ncbi:Tagatose-6-phosphate kinase [Caulifigura coniformis]|uniref:Tagatose-6-phosphate kinase n=1 Tax=Caulifigura coniformis TaxID=2527983 RepID=A0A517S7M5_9PLAN|nr:1-phosphofructokinase family hexose kinase [Caulifigura coniformis]QDT52126.1 Tagatose-6-phosphate kinase [Caulifigura coniformis]